ncbi:MAG: S-layer homology domain-containing protein, partial [Clostridia bacterium]|nr:S-layer homology domain-containing protein [Clostridia bacterium]
VGDGVTGNYNTEHEIYGRFVPGDTGDLVIDVAAIDGGNAVAMIGSTMYDTLEAAVAAATESDEVIILKADTYKLPNLPKNITVKASVEGVVINAVGSGSIASVPSGAAFENLTFNFGASNYHGFQHAGDIAMKGCTLNGLFFSYGNMSFDSCTFNAPGTDASGLTGKDYSMWAYGKDLTFTDCTFNCAGKCINVYCERNTEPYVITASGCTFNSSVSNKAAFNVKETCGNNVLLYQVNISDCTANENFPAAKEDGKLKVFGPLVQVDDRIPEGTENGGEIRITMDNAEVYKTPGTVKVAKIGETEYKTLAEAVAAVPTDGTQTTITMIAEEAITGNAGVEIKKGQNVVLDLNGFTVKNSVNENKASQVIKNSGTLTICDNSAEGTGLLTNAVEDGTQAGEWWGTQQYNYATNVILNCGTLTVASGEIYETAAGSICYAIDNNSSGADAVLNVDGGYIHKDSGTAVRMFCNSTTFENTLNMTDGTLEAGYSGLWIQLPGSSAQKKKATLNVSGGTMKGEYAFYDYSYGDLFDEVQYTISGGEFDGDVFSYGANIAISGGTFNGEVAVKQSKPSEIAVTGGCFGADVYNYGDSYQEYFISGGVFALDPEGYVGEYTVDYDLCISPEKSVIVNTDAETKEQYPYAIGVAAAVLKGENGSEQAFGSLQDAIDAAEDGDEIEVLAENEEAVVNRPLSFKLSGNGAQNAMIEAGEGYEKTEEDGSVIIREKPETVAPSTPYTPTQSYPVETPAETKNGSVSTSVDSAIPGQKVTVSVKPDKGYTPEIISVRDEKGNEIPLTKNDDGTYSFNMPAGKVTVNATFMEDNSMLNFFVDVGAKDYFYDSVLWAAENGITKGTDNVHFTPYGICTRAEVVTFLWRASGSPEPKSLNCPFSDVDMNSFYGKAVMWAFENGITKGTSDTAFSPNMVITRSQAVTFLYRMNKIDTLNLKVNPFKDVQEGAFYYDAVLWAYDNGITEGTSATTFAPDAQCQRAQIVTFLYRFFVK